MQHDRLAIRLYVTQRDALVDYAAKIVGDRSLAEDIVQDAWLALDRRRGAEAVLEPQGYLRATVRNLAIDKLRRKSRERRVGGEDLAVAARSTAHDAPSAEAAAIHREDLRCVMVVLASLPDRQRIAIEMYRFGGRKLREIAEHLGVSVPLVHLLISEGLAICSQRCGLNRS